MRSVSWAIWTSVEPVSVAVLPNFSRSSVLRSLVRAMRRSRVAASGREFPRALDVAVHLIHEGVDGREPTLAPQPREELQPKFGPVQVAGEIEDVGLDQDATTGLERG